MSLAKIIGVSLLVVLAILGFVGFIIACILINWNDDARISMMCQQTGDFLTVAEVLYILRECESTPDEYYCIELKDDIDTFTAEIKDYYNKYGVSKCIDIWPF